MQMPAVRIRDCRELIPIERFILKKRRCNGIERIAIDGKGADSPRNAPL